MMISFDSVPVYLACGPTDLRKQINGLCTKVSADFEMDPFDSALFVFCNRNKNRLKVLLFDGDGFMMITKRLEKGRFRWPSKIEDEDTMALDVSELYALLSSTRIERRIRRDEVTERAAW
ncbi:MAG: IS66 family insertion sequence element accessory protein TnpB [Coriobacteriia bacterium]|nr:IS66 family insertion sequence element accessory protein TnpB [Coriobacteriia bacterium]